MTVAVFVDTNVLLYAVDRSDPGKHTAALAWRAQLWKTRTGRTSYQVLQEFYTNVLKKWPSAAAAAQAEVRDLFAWRPVAVDGPLLERGWKVQNRYRLSFWDAMIVAAAQHTGSQYLLTDDLQPGQNFDGVIVLDPFASAPQPVLG
jgi:predicted nucleic acid-binding protein